MAGLPEPKVVSNLANRGKVIDAAVDSAVKPTVAKPVAEAPEKPAKPITADEAMAKAAKYKADQEAFDAETKRQAGLPKPGLLGRLLGK